MVNSSLTQEFQLEGKRVAKGRNLKQAAAVSWFVVVVYKVEAPSAGFQVSSSCRVLEQLSTEVCNLGGVKMFQSTEFVNHATFSVSQWGACDALTVRLVSWFALVTAAIEALLLEARAPCSL